MNFPIEIFLLLLVCVLMVNKYRTLTHRRRESHRDLIAPLLEKYRLAIRKIETPPRGPQAPFRDREIQPHPWGMRTFFTASRQHVQIRRIVCADSTGLEMVVWAKVLCRGERVVEVVLKIDSDEIPEMFKDLNGYRSQYS
jgi:hypothetical protein